MNRIIFLGQKPIGEKCFFRLLEFESEKIRVVGAVSNSSTECWWSSAEIFKECGARRIPFVDNGRRNEDDLLDLIESENANMLISVQHSWILSSEILKRVNYNGFNLHNAKLPEYRGYNSFSHAILNQEVMYYSTIHRLADKVDQGDIAFEASFEINSEDTAHSLYLKSLHISQKIFLELLHALQMGKPIPAIKMKGKGKFYGKHSLDEIRIPPIGTSDEDLNLIARALYFPPFEPPYQLVDGKKEYLLPNASLAELE
jgi:methionyl-tRNA formyltransferase